VAGFRGPIAGSPGGRGYAGVAGADLENAPEGPVPFTSPIGIPQAKFVRWHAGGNALGVPGGVPGRQIQRASKDRPVIEHNDSFPVFPNRLDLPACFVRQTADGDVDFQANWIRTRGKSGIVLRILGRRTRLARAIQVRGVFYSERHGIPIMNGPTHRGLRAPSE